MKTKRYLWWTVIVTGFLIVVMIGVMVLQKIRGKPSEDTKERPAAITVMNIHARDIEDSVVLPGRIEPLHSVSLAAEKGGRVVELAVDKGSIVEEGQVLLRVDARKWNDYLEQARIQSREAEKDYLRFEELKKTGAVSDADFDSITRRRDLAALALDEAEVNVSQCDVVSPIPGIVDERHIDLGEFANEGQRVIDVVNIDNVKVVVDVPERDVLSLKQGDEVAFDVLAYPDRVFTGKASFVSVAARHGSNSYRAEILAENEDGALKGGMIATATIIRGVMDDAIVVPLNAVVPQKGDSVVFVVKGERVERRVVRIDRIIGEEAVLASGLSADESIVIEGQRSLHDGATVAVAAADSDSDEGSK
jgi:membrane fusion protein (multidrug efflux system)